MRLRAPRLGRFSALSLLAFLAFFAVALAPLASEEAFGFGDSAVGGDEAITAGGDSLSLPSAGVKVGGEAVVGASLFFDDIDNGRSLRAAKLGDGFAGRLNFLASGSNADAAINLKVRPAESGATPIEVDEAYARAYWGKLDLEAGLRKLSWGKADSSGPLDAVNPLDYSDLTVTDALERKIARPMVHASYSLGSFTKLEGVFVPSFQGHSFATGGKWAPSQLSGMKDGLAKIADATVYKIIAGMAAKNIPTANATASLSASLSALSSSLSSIDLMSFYPDMSSLRYAQAGLRLTTSVASSDLGVQYYYGYLPRPAIAIDAEKLFPVNASNPLAPTLSFNRGAISVAYNPYHQIGVDWAAVVATLNARAELAANVTQDLSGDDGEVYNPSALWSLGFDRDLFAGINLNAQGAGSVRLMDDKVGSSPADCEGGTDMTHTTVTVKLTKKFLKDELELGAAGVWGVEDRDFLAMPELSWTKGDTELSFALGIFGGDWDGEMGQYGDNDYARISLKYAF